jgi:hypothetical protein
LPTIVDTVSTPWGFSATLDIAKLTRKLKNEDSDVFVEVDAEPLRGTVGIGLLVNYELSTEIFLDAKDGRHRHYIGVSGNEHDLLIRNAAVTNQSSTVAVHGVRILRQRKTAIDETHFLL